MAKQSDSLVHTIEVGPVVVEVLRGATNDGHVYLYFQLSRAWQAAAGKKRNHSNRFYDRNEKDVVKAVQEATSWIRKHPQAMDDGWQQPSNALAA